MATTYTFTIDSDLPLFSSPFQRVNICPFRVHHFQNSSHLIAYKAWVPWTLAFRIIILIATHSKQAVEVQIIWPGMDLSIRLWQYVYLTKMSPKCSTGNQGFAGHLREESMWAQSANEVKMQTEGDKASGGLVFYPSGPFRSISGNHLQQRLNLPCFWVCAWLSSTPHLLQNCANM